MKKINLFLVFCILLSSFMIPVYSEEATDNNIIYFNDFTKSLSSDDLLTLSPVKNTSQESIVLKEDEGVLLYRGSGSTAWTSTTSHAKIRLGNISEKPPLVYEVRFKTSLFSTSATINYRTSEGESPLFYLRANGELYDKLNGTLITTISDLEDWHTVTILFDNEADSDGKFYRTICVDGEKFENSRAEGNEYAKSGRFSVSPSASLQTLTDGRDREVRYDYIKIYSCPEEFSADIQLNEQRNEIALSFSFLPDTRTLLKENFILSDGTTNTNIRDIIKKSLKDYTLSLEQALSFDTTYILTLSNILDVQGKTISEPLIFHTRKARKNVEGISLSQGENIQDGTMTAQLSTLNETDQNVAAKLIVAKFDKENLMYAYEEKPFVLEKNIEKEVSVDFTVDSAAQKAQLFVLKDSEEFESLSGDYVFYRSSTPKSEGLLGLTPYENTPAFSYQIDDTTGEITLKIDCGEAERTVVIGLKKPNVDMLAFIGQANTSEEQIARFTFNLNEEGLFDVVYGVNGNSTLYRLPGAVTYYKAETINAEFEKINGTENTKDIGDFVANYGESIGLDLDKYNSYSAEEQNMILDSIIQQRNELTSGKFDSIDGFKASLEIAYMLMTAYKTEPAVTESLADILDKDDVEFYTENLTNRIQEAVSKKCVEDWHATPSEIQKAFQQAIILEGIRLGDNYSLTTSIIEKYGNEIPLDMSGYEGLDNAYEVSRKISGNTYESFEELQKAFEQAVKAQKEKESGKQTSTRPSGGNTNSGMHFYPQNPTPKPTGTPSPVTPPVMEIPFKDMDKFDWAKEAVKSLWEKGIIQGKDETIFAPEDSITRAELAKILIEAFEIEDKAADCVFSDVQDSDWYYDYVLKAYGNQLIIGVDNTHFDPNGQVSREMAATVLYRICKLKNIPLEDTEKVFSDDNLISDYAKEAVHLLGGNQIINGYEDGSFEPGRSCTRAEIVQLIYQLIS